MPNYLFRHAITEAGLTLTLHRRALFGQEQLIPASEWASSTGPDTFAAMAHVLRLVETGAAETSNDGNAVVLSHQVTAQLSEPMARALGLPSAAPYILNLRAENTVTDPAFDLRIKWIDNINRPIISTRLGSFLTVGNRSYRLPEPLYSLCEAVDKFRSTQKTDDQIRFSCLAKIQDLFPEEDRERFFLDPYLRDFRVLHATAFSLNIRTEGVGFQFDPVLFGRNVSSEVFGSDADEPDGQSRPVTETEGLLSEHQSELFARERFGQYTSARDRYVIESGTYLYLDPAVKDALSVVRRLQQADSESRKRFARSPRACLREELGSSYDAPTIDQLFIETEQFSERVIDVGLWSAPVLPWIVREPNTWLPEKFGVKIAGKYVELSADDLPALRESVENAIGFKEEAVEFRGERIPATTETLDALANLSGVVRPTTAKPAETIDAAASNVSRGKHVLIVSENFEQVGFSKKYARRALDFAAEVPTLVRTSPMPHQQGGFSWLHRAWATGFPGVLLADDMGLGKTFQVLMFLAWLKEFLAGKGAPQRPFLIIAPTGLLKNWEDEHALHLRPSGLGTLCRAYGNEIGRLRRERARDIDTGVPALDDEKMRGADWVLTTYETWRDYHFSFGKVHFGCAVLDEMQKVKNPGSLLSSAAKAINADFTVGLTGTPIENALEDLWVLIDILSPGRLGDLKSFSAKYRSAELESLEGLRKELMEPTEVPAPVLRRMKVDHLTGLPEKRLYVRRRPMPQMQAAAYAEVVKRAKGEDAPPVLETLHQLRGISLHPIWPQLSAVSDPDTYISQSARLSETFAILNEIADRREKALIFLESLEMQDQLALIIKQRFRLPKLPLQINGNLSGEKRKKAVDEFQNEKRGFGVMILSPKAGGVGLTLTAANHVIHLSRWWNPAVEDQCTDRIYRIGQKQPVNVYYPMAIHPDFGDGSFDEVLNTLLTRKRELGKRMLIPPVNAKQDEAWFTDNLGTTPKQHPEGTNLDEIDQMEPEQFERWAVQRMKARGYIADRTLRSHDKGADGIFVHKETKCRVILQCKLRQKSDGYCGEAAVDDLLRARTSYGNGPVTLVGLTNAMDFTEKTKRRARDLGIILVARDDLANWPIGII